MPNALAGSSKQRVAGSNPAGRTCSKAILDLHPRVRGAKQGANGVAWEP